MAGANPTCPAVVAAADEPSNFDFLYFDLQHRTNWGFRLFDNRSFFTAPDFPPPLTLTVPVTLTCV